jgi:hypothetical protein
MTTPAITLTTASTSATAITLTTAPTAPTIAPIDAALAPHGALLASRLTALVRRRGAGLGLALAILASSGAGALLAQAEHPATGTLPVETRAPLARPAIATTVPVERRIDAHLEYLASDDLGGRETGTVHSQVTAQYVASVFRSIGLQPGGDAGSYFQKYPLSANRLVAEETTLRLSSAQSDALAFTLFDDYVVRGTADTGVDLAGEVVFAGHGLVSETAGVDDYAGLDVKGRFVLALDGRPSGHAELRGAAQWRAKKEAALSRGAIGLALITDPDDKQARELFEQLADQGRHPPMTLAGEDQPAAWPIVMLKAGPAAAVLAGGGLSLDTEKAARATAYVPGRALPGVRLALKAVVRAELTHASNIVGVLPGSDPLLAGEYLILSAHNDHIGIARDGRINNGADDNASGTTTLLATAEVLAAGPPPRRSILFLSVSGEEKGLWGSSWWCDHPTVPLDRCIGNINIDMVGRNDPDAVGATPSPKHPDFNTLVQRAVDLGPQAGMHVTWTAPAAGEDLVDNYYQRSDHYNFAAKGIPVVFFFSGLHEDYHRPTDTVEKINRDKLYRMVALVELLVADVANAAGRPAKVTGG